MKPPLLPICLLLRGIELGAFILLAIQRYRSGESTHTLYLGLCRLSSGMSRVQVRVCTYSKNNLIILDTFVIYGRIRICTADSFPGVASCEKVHANALQRENSALKCKLTPGRIPNILPGIFCFRASDEGHGKTADDPNKEPRGRIDCVGKVSGCCRVSRDDGFQAGYMYGLSWQILLHPWCEKWTHNRDSSVQVLL